MLQLLRAILLVLVFTGSAGCGYGFRSGQVREGLDTVGVAFFENRSTEPGVEVAPAFEMIVQKLLTKNVANRYQSAKKVLKDLKSKVIPLYRKKPQKKTFFSRFFGRG